MAVQSPSTFSYQSKNYNYYPSQGNPLGGWGTAWSQPGNQTGYNQGSRQGNPVQLSDMFKGIQNQNSYFNPLQKQYYQKQLVDQQQNYLRQPTNQPFSLSNWLAGINRGY